MENKIVPFQLQRISQTLTTLEGGGGGGEGGTFPMFLREKFIRTQERKKIATVLKYCLNIAKDTYLDSKQLSMPIIWSCHVTSEFLINSL